MRNKLLIFLCCLIMPLQVHALEVQRLSNNSIVIEEKENDIFFSLPSNWSFVSSNKDSFLFVNNRETTHISVEFLRQNTGMYTNQLSEQAKQGFIDRLTQNSTEAIKRNGYEVRIAQGQFWNYTVTTSDGLKNVSYISGMAYAKSKDNNFTGDLCESYVFVFPKSIMLVTVYYDGKRANSYDFDTVKDILIRIS